MKKVIALLLAGLLLALSGCFSGTPNPPVTLSLWHYYNGANKDKFDSIVQSFNETVGNEKGILVDAYAFSGVNDLAEAVFSSAKKDVGAKNLPDIFAAYADNVFRIDALEIVAPLDEYFTTAELNKYHVDFLTEGRFDKQQNLKIIPIAKSTEIFYINQTDFATFSEATGVQLDQFSTWEGILDAAAQYWTWTDALTPVPDDGKALFGVDSVANFMLIAAKQLGEDMYGYDPSGVRLAVSKDALRKMWDVMYVPYVKGHYATIGRFRSDDTKSGDLLAYVGSTASANYFPTQVQKSKDGAYPIECVTLPYPTFEDGAQVAVQQGAGMVVTKSDEAREKASVEFLKWFTAPAQNIGYAVSTGYMPVQTEALQLDTILAQLEKTPNLDSNGAIVRTAQIIYNLPAQHMLYTSKPFASSFDARKVLENHMLDAVRVAQETLETRVAAGEQRDVVLSELVGAESFEHWFQSFTNEMEKLLK